MFIFILALPNWIHNPIYHTWTFSNIVGTVSFFSIPIFISLYVSFGLCLTLERERLCRIDYFIWKKCFNVNDIVSISYPPTFIFGGNNRTLSIVANINGTFKEISMSYPVFTKKTLVKAVNDLLFKNPNIQIDADVENLLQEHANS